MAAEAKMDGALTIASGTGAVAQAGAWIVSIPLPAQEMPGTDADGGHSWQL